MAELTGRKLCLFDFDGTLTRKDTLFEIIKHIHGRWRFYRGMLALSPSLVLYLIKIIPNWKAKENMLIYFFKGMAIDLFQAKCDEFASDQLPNLIREGVIEKLTQLRNERIETIIVSASVENWIASWCVNQGVDYIATQLEVKNGRLTGKIKGKNCYGAEKVNRIQQTIDLSQYDEIIAYGDSKGDLPMLRLATQSFYRAFH